MTEKKHSTQKQSNDATYVVERWCGWSKSWVVDNEFWTLEAARDRVSELDSRSNADVRFRIMRAVSYDGNVVKTRVLQAEWDPIAATNDLMDKWADDYSERRK